MDLFAKDFNTRQDLERKVSSLFGLTAETKANDKIIGTKQELKKLLLGHGSVFWGIRCEDQDFQTPAKTVKISRGKIHKEKLKSINIGDYV